MEIQLAVAKVVKFGSLESGDTLEIIERPMGGVSCILADARSSGTSAKSISSMVVRKIISLISDGVRDGAAARGASDYLFYGKRWFMQCLYEYTFGGFADADTCYFKE